MLKNYPHLSFLGISYTFAILLFLFIDHDFFRGLVEPLGLGGVFIVGMMYAYSFTISFGALLLPAFLAYFSPETIAIIGGLGGTFADITLFRFFKNDMKKEMRMLGATKFFKALGHIPFMKVRWVRDVIGFLIIISPFPDEIGIAIMASAHLSENTFRVLSLIANVIGIYLLVSIVGAIY